MAVSSMAETPRAKAPCVLRATDITILRNGRPILKGSSLSLGRGEFTALAGPSGSGKTSLLRVLANLDAPAGGEIYVSNERNDEMLLNDIDRVHPYLTYVPQTLALWPHMTLRDNLHFSCNGNPGELLDALCSELELDEALDRKPASASQGQRQRCALIRALLLRPRILLLDEITAALDERLASVTWAILRRLANGGVAVLASTHDARLSALCDDTIQLHSFDLRRVSVTGLAR